MLTLSDLFEQLQYGELSTMEEGGMHDDLCGSNLRGIKPDDYPRLITHINFGLINLYTKFPILEREVLIRQSIKRTKYPLSSKFAESTGKDPSKFILDEHDPFTDDVLRIDAAFDENGCAVPVNDSNKCNSIFTPSIDLVQIPNPREGEVLFLTYRAKPVKIPTTTTDLSTEILIPETLWEALCFYVASRAYSGIQTTQDLSNVYMTRYYNRIAEVEERNVFGNDFNDTNMMLEVRGWV